MSDPGWHQGPLASFDTETTGVDVYRDRIVTASLLLFAPRPSGGHTISARHWLINPGIPIPAAATAIHGITDQIATAHGTPPAQAITAIAAELRHLADMGTPLIIMNAPYDLTILCQEAIRHGVTSLVTPGQAEPNCQFGPVIDPGVIDRHLVQRRRGKRRLVDLCETYQIAVNDAHNAAADAFMAAGVTYRICQQYQQIPQIAPPELHALQIGWRAEQQQDLATYFRSIGKDATIDTAWPIRPLHLD